MVTICLTVSGLPPRGAAEVRPRCSRGAADVRPRCGRSAAEVRPKCDAVQGLSVSDLDSSSAPKLEVGAHALRDGVQREAGRV